MTEKEFIAQVFLLKCDIEACPMVSAFAAEQRDRWASRLGDLLNRRSAARDFLAHDDEVGDADARPPT